jgi:hypothetical protein
VYVSKEAELEFGRRWKGRVGEGGWASEMVRWKDVMVVAGSEGGF